MIGMSVGQDHVANGQARDEPDGPTQGFAIFEAATGVHRGHALPADDEPDVGDGAAVRGVGFFIPAAAHEEAAAEGVEERAIGDGPDRGQQRLRARGRAEQSERGLSSRDQPRAGAVHA